MASQRRSFLVTETTGGRPLSDKGHLSRRDLLFGRIGSAIKRAAEKPKEVVKRAVIQGRHCLAYRGLMCSTCHERCPEEGAIVIERGIPRVVTDLCTGCGDCHKVCPAPINAILITTPRIQVNRTDA